MSWVNAIKAAVSIIQAPAPAEFKELKLPERPQLVAQLPQRPEEPKQIPKQIAPGNLDFVETLNKKAALQFEVTVKPKDAVGTLVVIPQIHQGLSGPVADLATPIIRDREGKPLNDTFSRIVQSQRIEVKGTLLKLRGALPPERLRTVIGEGVMLGEKEFSPQEIVSYRTHEFMEVLKDKEMRPFLKDFIKKNQGAWDKIPNQDIARLCEGWRTRLEKIIVAYDTTDVSVTKLRIESLIRDMTCSTDYSYLLKSYGYDLKPGEDPKWFNAHALALFGGEAAIGAWLGPLAMEKREDVTVKQGAELLASGKHGDVVVVVYGAHHKFKSNVENWNAKNPKQKMILVEAKNNRD